MARLSSGLIIAGAYANKIRRVMFAMEKRVDSKEIARAVGELNSTLFHVIRETGIEKGDVVRITIQYDVEDGRIVWNWDTLEVQHYRLVPETSEKVKEILPKALEEARAAMAVPEEVEAAPPAEVEAREEAAPLGEFTVDYLGSSEDGIEDIYTVKVRVGEEYQLAGVARVMVEGEEGKAIVVIVTPEEKPRAYKLTLTLPYVSDPRRAADALKEKISEAAKAGELSELKPEEAKKLIRELMQQS